MRVAYISEDISSVSYIWHHVELIENKPSGHVGHLKDSVRYEASLVLPRIWSEEEYNMSLSSAIHTYFSLHSEVISAQVV